MADERKSGESRLEPELVKGRMRFIGAARQFLEARGFLEVQTPVLHPRLGGFEKGVGFSTFSSSLGERLWFRAAPELYLKRFIIEGQRAGIDRIFELAICLRDEYNERVPADSFDRPELTLLELYSCEDDPWVMEALLRGMLEGAVARLNGEKLLLGSEAKKASAMLLRPWKRQEFGALLTSVDPAFDLEVLLNATWAGGPDKQPPDGPDRATYQARAIEARAGAEALRDAAQGLAYRGGGLGQYLRLGPQGYWYDFIDHAFQTRVAPALIEPTIVHRMPLESSLLAESSDGVHCEKWELYASGVRVALAQKELMDAAAQRVRFEHLDRLRRLGYELVPEPDESFIAALEAWPAGRPLVGMGVYIDRLAGIVLGILGQDARGQERMIPNLFKLGSPAK